MADITEGLYVTELMGTGVNGITGDYSRGAAGFMIRGGAIAEPVADPVATAAVPPRPDAMLRRFRASLHDGRVHPLYVALRHLRAADLAVSGG